MRLTAINIVVSTISLAMVGVTVLMDWLQDSGTLTANIAFYAWIGAAATFAIALLMSIVNTFTEVTGFVHPEDKLVCNMLVFLVAISTTLTLGVLTEGMPYQYHLYTIASMILIAYVFLFVFVYFSRAITHGGEMGQVKEMTARFMLVALLLGAIMSGLVVLLDYIYNLPGLQYGGAALALGGFSTLLVVIILLVLGRRYEPVGQ
ncbi:MAG: hypothetical protein QXS20_09010 [Candidatus Thorarchaeota archaeon]